MTLNSTLDLISYMQKGVTQKRIPLQTVEGKINPVYVATEFYKDPPMGLPTEVWERRLVLKVNNRVARLIEEEERIIDEFCGLIPEQPEDTRTWHPQYPVVEPFYIRRTLAWEAVLPLYNYGPRMPPFD